MLTNFIYMIAYIAEFAIFFQYCSSNFSSKISLSKNILMLSFFYGIMFFVSFFRISNLNLIFFLFLNFIYILYAYDTPWRSALFHTLIATALMLLSELLISSLFFQIGYHFFANLHFTERLLFLTIMSKLIYFFFLIDIPRIFSASSKRALIHSKGTLLLTLTIIFSLFTCLIFAIISEHVKLPPVLDTLVSISAVLMLVLNFLVLWFYDDLQKKSEQYLELCLQQQKESAYSQYQKAVLREDENQKILIHDIRNHLQAIAALNADGGTKEVADYIEHLCDSSSLRTAVRVCDNELLNSLIARYASQCAQKHIELRTDIRSRSINFITDDELTGIIGNILDNAIRSAETFPHSYIELNIRYREKISTTVISLINSCSQNPFNAARQLISTKKEEGFHGYGLKSIERITARYHGDMEVYYDEPTHTFHTIITLKGVPRLNP